MANRLAAALAIVAVFLVPGCNSSPASSSAAASSSSAGAASSSSKPAAPAEIKSSVPQGVTTTTITDPSLNHMVAGSLTIPSGWKAQGILLTSPCTGGPNPVFRAYSPDGLTQMRSEPQVGWGWHPNLHGGGLPPGCIGLSSAMTAAQFLSYYVTTIQGGVHVVGAMPVSAQYKQWASTLAANQNQGNNDMAPALRSQHTVDVGALRVQVVNGSFLVEERLRAATICAVNNNPGPLTGGTCTGRIDILSAPVGKLDALVALADGHNLPNSVPSQQWQQAYLIQQQRKDAQMIANLTALEASETKAIYQQFQQIMARSQAEHQAFMQQQESQFQSAMSNANASMNAQTTSASDWVDYSLDQQTVAGPNGTAKVSSAYSQTWTNGTQWYQTDNPNSNPNGSLQGNWTLTTKVHGNGQSY
jgi:hypothetical protein